MNTQRKVHVNNDLDIVMARMQAREMAKQMGFGTADQARISLAASELARVLSWNTNSGEIVMSVANQNGQQGLQVVCLVSLAYLPHEKNTDQAKEASIPTRSLAGACRLVDESIVEEQVGEQARVTLIKWLN